MKHSTLLLVLISLYFISALGNFINALWSLSVLHLAISIVWFIGGVIWIEGYKDTKDLYW